MTSFSERFGGNAIKPAQPQYEPLDIATSTTLVWPLESTTGSPYVAAQIDVDASVAGLSIMMPPANQGSLGVATMMTNVGSHSFTLRDSTGVQIAVLAATQTWIITLIDNSTEAGVWRAYQMASTSSNAVASALAGAGLEADGTQLRIAIPTQHFVTSASIDAQYRAYLLVYDGATNSTFQFDESANLGVGWDCLVTNLGTGSLTLTTSISEPINGATSLVLEPGNSCLVVCEAGGFNTVGNVDAPLSILNGGTGATNGTQALINLGGSTIGVSIFTAASAAAVVALLGLSATSPLTESTVTTDQTLDAGSTQTAYVATAALTLNLPLTTGLTTDYIFAVYAQTGAVTISPNVADQVDAGGAGVDYTVAEGQSALFVTDANHNWWPLFAGGGGGGGGGVTSVAMTAPAQFVVTGSPVTSTGTLALAWATQTANKVLASAASGGAAVPTFRALVTADLPAIAVDIPTGLVFDFGGPLATIPAGYLPCDGAAVSRTTYVDLFNAIGTRWGLGDGSTTFNVPDLSRRTTVGSGGVGTGTLGNSVGNTGGAETVTLTTAQIPAHSHAVTDPGHVHSLTGVIQIDPTGDDQVGGNTFDARFTGGSVDSATTGITNQNTGGGGSHNNIQPSAIVLKIIKT